jgi:hypothetical protein
MVTLSDLFIDKLTLTYQCERADTEGIASTIRDYQQSDTHSLIYRGIWYKDRGYLHSWDLIIPTPHGSEFVLLQTKSKYLNGTGFRVELNPRKLGATGTALLWDKLENFLINEHQYFFNEAKVTRIDLAADATPIAPESFFVENRSLRSGDIKTGNRGEIQTINLGSRRSRTYFCIYNRDKYTKRRISNNQFTTRFEARLKPNCSLFELQLIKNPFDGLTVVTAIDPVELINAPIRYKHFLDSVNRRGLQGALGMFPDSRTKKTYREWIKAHCDADWFNPDDIWLGLDPALDSLSLPFTAPITEPSVPVVHRR